MLHLLNIKTIVIFTLLFSVTSLHAKDSHPAANETIRVVIHLTSSNPNTYTRTISYIETIRNEFPNKTDIKIVANGRGIAFVNSNNKFKPDVERLLEEGVEISACNTTAQIIRQYRKLPIVEGVNFVPTGIVEVNELQRKKYIYIKP